MSLATDAIDTQIASFRTAAVNRQTTYFGNHGRYFQGLLWSSVVPADGALAVIDLWDTTPDYQQVTWRNWFGSLLTGVTCAGWIDQYVGPVGPGWVLGVWVLQSGVLWERLINVGPESWRSVAWQAV